MWSKYIYIYFFLLIFVIVSFHILKILPSLNKEKENVTSEGGGGGEWG